MSIKGREKWNFPDIQKLWSYKKIEKKKNA